MEIGDRIFTMKRVYITKIGISKKDDRLPERFSETPRVVSGNKIYADVESMFPSYYKLRGWNDDGIPTTEKMKKLKIKPI
ncbi:MAG: aldehyde:ferredoxin oxidoreductase [Thermoproteota archaeon]|nr:aldehyde:ferredoxin oxidoreductase [Thermoproteota archaeon]